jgi:hypothetical protein
VKSIIKRASHLERISSVLGRLATDAQSPDLRREVAGLGGRYHEREGHDDGVDRQLAASSGSGTPAAQVTDQIGRRLWPILQSGISFTFTRTSRPPALANPAGSQTIDSAAEDPDEGNHSEGTVDDYQTQETNLSYHQWEHSQGPIQFGDIEEGGLRWDFDEALETYNQIWEPVASQHYRTPSPDLMSVREFPVPHNPLCEHANMWDSNKRTK